MASWQVGDRRGPAAELHGLVPTGGARVAEWYEVTGPALVLGSAQRDDVVDRAACAAAGVDVVRRRSGGGVVLLVPGESLWLDVVVPRGDPLWDDDVARAMWWLGDVWCEALAALGVTGAEVHRGALVHTPWSRLVCFDGIGSGEVIAGERKAVGISQRRTRDWLRLQSSVHLAWRPELLVSLLAPGSGPDSPPIPTAAQLRPALTLDIAPDDVRTAVERALRTR
jgi:lipoate-protein ligase A